jgi:hypothetical protein
MQRKLQKRSDPALSAAGSDQIPKLNVSASRRDHAFRSPNSKPVLVPVLPRVKAAGCAVVCDQPV